LEFPIDDVNAEKKLRYEMEEIMGVYLHHEEEKWKGPIKVK
jgi:hypothetical protein